MRALVFTGEPPQLRLDPQAPAPIPGPDEALVHVRLAGICATDLALIRGYAGFRGVLGHEFVGVVDAGDPLLAGRRVVADINLGCGECPACRRDDPHHCRARRVLGIRGAPGAFADCLAVPRDRLVPVPDDLDDERAVFAEPLAAALHVLDDLGDGPGEGDQPIAVIGDGKLGLLIALALAGAGRPVRLIGHHRDKLALARAGNPAIDGVLEPELAATDHAARYAAVVDASGHPSGLALALALVRPRGRVILKSTLALPVTVDLARVVVDELRLIGSRCGDMARALAVLARGAVDPRPLIAARYDLDDALAAMAHAGGPGAGKILLAPRRPYNLGA